jgi:16S rRNA processing protein RimM
MTKQSPPSQANTGKSVCMAQIMGAHGVRGMVKIKIFADDPHTLVNYGALHDEKNQRSFNFLKLHQHGSIWLAEVEGLTDRTEAEKLRGTKLFLDRALLPDIQDEKTYYHVDLIGMTAKTTDGAIVGKVIAVANFGAGDLLDIKPPKGNSFYLPFCDRTVPVVDLDAKEMTVEIPHGLLD